MTKWILLLLLALTLSFSAGAQDGAIGSSQLAEIPESSYIHGTIDVVVRTKEGFVLAADSRLTWGSAPPHFTDNGQKLFVIGTRGAVVMAGLVGSGEMGWSGFHLSDQMGSHLVALDKYVTATNVPAPASWIAPHFSNGFGSLIGLVPTSVDPSSLVGEAEVVSVLEDGKTDWVSVSLQPLLVKDELGDFYTIGPPVYLNHNLTKRPHFKVKPIGQPAIVVKLISATSSFDNGFSSSEVMKKYYKRKRAGKLDSYTIAEAVELARGLEEESIRALPRGAGVGGPIDILTLTKNGAHWIQRKPDSAPFPLINEGQYIRGLRMLDNIIGIDGLHCVHCTFVDMKFYYRGRGDVELLDPRIGGTCHIRIAKSALTRTPGNVEQLKSGLRGKCDFVELDDKDLLAGY